MAIHWYPGHMHKAIKEIREILPKIDLVIEVVDARLPYSSENPVIQTFSAEIPCIKVLSKSDLADPVITQQWMDYYNQQDNITAITSSLNQTDIPQRLTDLSSRLAPAKEDQVKPVLALITGIPNVGKSTLINHLTGRSIAKTGNEPAVTKGQQKIKVTEKFYLLDTPGILWPKIDNEKSSYRLATSGAIKDTAMSHDDVAFFAAGYLLEAYPDLLKKRYQLDNTNLSEVEFLEIIGQKRGCLGSGGHVDFDKISKLFLNEIRDATIGKISFESPEMAIREIRETEELVAAKLAEKEAKKEARKKKRKK